MKRWIVLGISGAALLIAGAACGAVALVFFWADAAATDLTRVKGGFFFNNAYALKRLQEGSPGEAIAYMRVQNELGLMALETESPSSKAQFLNNERDIIVWVCGDLSSAPAPNERSRKRREHALAVCAKVQPSGR